MRRPSKNQITIEQLQLACRHVHEMRSAGVSENMAIRTLENFADVYAKLHTGGSATPHHVDQFELWSVRARALREDLPEGKPRDYLRVEHGTPKRAFARMILDLFSRDQLTSAEMARLISRYWRIAILTIEEDERLNRIARTKAYQRPEDRWAAAGIEF